MANSCNILLYSKTCDASKKLLAVIEHEQLTKFFKYICIDDKLHSLPPQIKAVPAMIIKNFSKPLTPVECFKFIKHLLNHKNSQTEEQTKSNDLNGFNPLEHISFSDIFTHIQGDDAIDQSHFKYGSEK